MLVNIHCKVLKDEWTVVTKDKKPSAQWEHTLLVTETGVEVLTLRPEETLSTYLLITINSDNQPLIIKTKWLFNPPFFTEVKMHLGSFSPLKIEQKNLNLSFLKKTPSTI